MFKILLILFISSTVWSSKIVKTGKVVQLFPKPSEKNLINPPKKDKIQKEKCFKMFSNNPHFSNWQEAIESKKTAEEEFSLAKKDYREAQKNRLIAKKISKYKKRLLKIPILKLIKKLLSFLIQPFQKS